MKKLILVLAILLAVPAFGALSISLQPQSPDANKINVNYAGADGNNLPRAFALNIEVNSPATIKDVNSFKIGESNSTNPGFGIYPARIVIEANGTVTSWGTPLAESTDPGAGTGLGTQKVVLEFGSLYVGDGNAPAASGTLCTLTIDCNGATGVKNVTATEEDTYRGGVVLEDGTTPSPNLTASTTVTCGVPCPGQATILSPGNDTNNVARSTNLTWTAGSDANSHRINFGTTNPPSFVAEQSGTSFDPNSTGGGLLGQGRKFYWRIDEKNDCGITTGTVWNFTTEECYKGTDPNYNTIWVPLGRPDCWCFRKQCRGDGNGASASGRPVSNADLTNFQAGFNKATTVLKGLNDSAGVPAACGDYNHTAASGRPITNADLTIFQAYFNKANTILPACPSTHINFWTN